MTLQWTEDLAVGHPVIDNQHKELIARFNQFLEACHQRQGKESLQELFGFLNDYVVRHFREEEQIMARHDYPALAAHHQEHREFTRRLGALQEELEKTGPTVSVLIQTNKALLYWLTNHIKQVDVALGKFLAATAAT